jgi:hypothetical protein
MDAGFDSFADRVYIELDLECDQCHASFVAPDPAESGESGWRRWANETVEAARLAGWRMNSEQMILCPDCVKKK